MSIRKEKIAFLKKELQDVHLNRFLHHPYAGILMLYERDNLDVFQQKRLIHSAGAVGLFFRSICPSEYKDSQAQPSTFIHTIELRYLTHDETQKFREIQKVWEEECKIKKIELFSFVDRTKYIMELASKKMPYMSDAVGEKSELRKYSFDEKYTNLAKAALCRMKRNEDEFGDILLNIASNFCVGKEKMPQHFDSFVWTLIYQICLLKEFFTNDDFKLKHGALFRNFHDMYYSFDSWED